MLRIAVAGTLAKHIESLAALNTRTMVEWLALPADSADLIKSDLILHIKADPRAEETIAEVLNSKAELGPLVTSWEEVPSEVNVDFAIQNSLKTVYGFIVGYSDAMHRVCQWVRTIAHQAAAALDVRTLITGETGTGKELIARAIHRVGIRREEPFIALNCGGFPPPDLIDSQLFGHIKGAYSGAKEDRDGAMYLAGNGVLFLDEIGEMPFSVQTKFLRVLEQRTFSSLGSFKNIDFKAQVISATNRRLDEEVKQGGFRADLYFRIAQLVISLPPLRERTDDIPLLINAFLCDYQLSPDIINQASWPVILNYKWPGNIRELHSAVSRLALLAQGGGALRVEDWVPHSPSVAVEEPIPTGTLTSLREDFERRILEAVISKCGGDTNCVAKELGITRRTVYNLARRYKIKLGKQENA